MDNFDAPYHPEYEKALKETSMSGIIGKVLPIQTEKSNLINCPHSKYRNGLQIESPKD